MICSFSFSARVSSTPGVPLPALLEPPSAGAVVDGVVLDGVPYSGVAVEGVLGTVTDGVRVVLGAV